jgi:hypothetical protein
VADIVNQASEDLKRRGRVEALVLTMAQAAMEYSNWLKGLPSEFVDGASDPVRYFDELIRVTATNPAFHGVQQLAQQGRMIALLIKSGTALDHATLMEVLNTALAVDGSLRRGLTFLQAERAASQELAAIRQQTGELQYTTDQLITLGSQQIERERLHHEGVLAMIDAAVTFAGATIKALLLLNGGAAVALLAFIGHLVTSNGSDLAISPTALGPALLLFSWGALCGGAVAALSYLAQILFKEESQRESRAWTIAAEAFRISAVSTAIAGFVLFGVAVSKAAAVFGVS